MVLAVTANFARKAHAARAWALDVLEGPEPRPDVVFAQEVPQRGWLDLWRRDYHVVAVPTPGWQVQSAVITRLPVIRDAIALSSAAYHGSYVQTAVVSWPDGGPPVRLVSFHASPTPAKPRYTGSWPPTMPPVVGRQGGGKWDGQPFDSDYVVATLVHHAAFGERILAAGDLNECQEWDRINNQNWWPALQNTLEAAGLQLPLRRIFNPERRTRFVGEHAYQLDHVIATTDIADRIQEAQVDGRWSNVEQVQRDGLSDHAPVWFNISTTVPRR